MLSTKWYRITANCISYSFKDKNDFATVQLVGQKCTNEWPAQGAICEVLAESEDSACNLASIFDQVKLFRFKAYFVTNCEKETSVRPVILNI